MKLGLVFEGGASRAYFSCGVMDGLLDAGIAGDYVIGTSAGIANAVSMVSRQKGRNLQIAKDYLHDKRYMGFFYLLNPNNRSYYNMNFIFDEIPNRVLPFDYDTFSQFPGKVVATVTNVQTGLPEYIEIDPQDRQMLALRASCALPLLFPVIELNGDKYLDGGITMPIPVSQAVAEGCDKILVVLTRERGYQKTPEKTLKLATRVYRQYPALVAALKKRHELYNTNLKELFELEAAGKVFVIAPDSMQGIRRTESDGPVLEKLYNQGYQHFNAILPEIKEYLQQ